MTSRKFAELYRQLNPAQKQAVDTIDGPVMVIAGPGTGKTQVLTLRIANILRQTDTPPDAILALAFTRSAVYTLRQRLVEIMGSVAYRVKIHTFHGLCHEIIRTYPEYFPRIIGSTAAVVVDQIKIITEVLNRTRFKFLKPFGAPYYYLYPVLEAISRLKKENITPAGLAKFTRTLKPGRERERNLELLQLYRAYERELARRQLYDFNDMVMETVRVLGRDTEFRARLQEEYHYVLADEQQDANQGQNELLRLLTNFDDNPNLFIVGDAKQAIFQFQGASLDNFNYFRRLFPQAIIITLSDNYRSGQLILDAAWSLISTSRGLDQESLAPLRARVATGRLGQKRITLRIFTGESAELNWLVETIKGKMKSVTGLTYDRLAVIFRDNRDARPLVEIFEQDGIPFVVESETNVLGDIDVRKLILLLRAIHHFGDETYLAPVLLFDFLRLPPLDVWRLTTAGRRQTLYGLMRSLDTLKALGLDRPEKFEKFYRQLEHWRRWSGNHNFTDLLGLVLEESGFLPYLLKQAAAVEKLEKLQSFFAEMKNVLKNNPDFSLTDFIEYVNLLEEHHLAISLRSSGRRDGVRLLTAHKAKGLEFDYVYVVRAYDGHFGRRRTVNFFTLPVRGTHGAAEETESERRLFYVALTRGKREVAVSYAEADEEGRYRLPSQFLEEIDKKLLTTTRMDTWEKARSSKSVSGLRPRTYTGVGLANRAFLNQLFSTRGLSVTALNNYLVCPLRYFFNNLLRVIKVQRRELLYGSAVHETLKSFFDRYGREDQVSSQSLITAFRLALGRQPVSPIDRPVLLTKGERALSGYFKHYYPKWPRAIINEFRVHSVLLDKELKLTGQIDKIEFLSGGGNEVNVVDYKTGRPKSRREILGQNKNSTGDYFRQLVFYKLLLDNYSASGGTSTAGKYRVVTGELDFIEADEKGRQHKEKFALTAEDVAELREQIQEVASEIRSLKFLRHGCGKTSCEACALWRMMGRRV